MPPSEPTSRTDPPPAVAAAAQARARHWRRTQRVTGALLFVWFAVGFGVTWFARDLDFPFFGWPFSFWVAAQGGVIVFVVLIAVYARRMAHVDRALVDDGGLPVEAVPAGPATVAEARRDIRREGRR
jgi:putative solute:sodium symporter small subunit